MRTTFKIALASVLVFTLAAAAPELNAQARRSTTTTSTSSSSDNKSTATASRSSASSSSTASRSTNTATRSAGTTANRQSNSTAARQGSTTTRNTAAPSGSTSTQVNRRSNTTGTTTESQVNRNNGSNGNTGNTGSTATRRSNGNTNSGSTAARQNNGTTRSAGNAAATTTETPSRRVTTSRSANNGTANAPTTQNTTPVTTVRSNAKATGGIRMDDNRNLNRDPPRERDFMTHDRPGAFFGHDPHYFGYRVHTLPPRYRRISHWGRDYYYYNNVYYLRYGNWYVITRPPFGLMIDIALRDLAFASVRFSYYHNVYRTFDIVDSNYRTILEQNREIARNNALLARQNSALALNSNRALSAYEIATALGLVQSFANINTEYFYEDGVFYVATKKNRYEVIVPPAGALVNELPDDYDTIVLNGVEYYKVDDTVYRLVLVDGIPALEVLGQMYGDMARKYNYYY